MFLKHNDLNLGIPWHLFISSIPSPLASEMPREDGVCPLTSLSLVCLDHRDISETKQWDGCTDSFDDR